MPTGLLTTYAAAHFGKSLLWHCSQLVFAFYLTEVLGLPPQNMGLVMAATLLANAAFDVFNGWWLGRFVADLRAAAKAQWLGCLIAALAFAGFGATGLLPAPIRETAAIAGLMIFHCGYSLLDVPQNSMLTFGASDDQGRNHIAALRYVAAGIAVLIVTACLAPWVKLTGAATKAGWFFLLTVLIACVAALTATALFLAVRNAKQGAGLLRQTPVETNAAAASPLGLAFLSILTFSLCVPLFSKLQAYYTAYALPGGAASYFMIAVALGSALSQALWVRIGRWWNLFALYRIAAASLGAAAIGFFFADGLGETALLLAGFFFGATSSGLLTSIWALLGKAAAKDTAKTTLRFGQFTFVSKTSQACSILVLGFLLQQFDYTAPGERALIITIMAAGPFCASLLCLALCGVPFPFHSRRREQPSAHGAEGLALHPDRAISLIG